MTDKKGMSKGLKITLICVALLIVILVIMLSFVFVFRSVNANLLVTSNTINNKAIQDKINTKDIVPFGQSVFFFNKNKTTSNIEKAVPSIKVINLEVRFPNILRVNCEERLPIFALKMNNSTVNYAILDKELKIINTLTSNNTYIDLTFKNKKGEVVLFNDLSAGNFIACEDSTNFITFLSKMEWYSFGASSLNNLFDNLEVYYRVKQDKCNMCVKFTTDIGYTIDIYDINSLIDKKINLLCSIIAGNSTNKNYVIDYDGNYFPN